MDDKFWFTLRIFLSLLPIGLAFASYDATQDVYAAILAALVAYILFWRVIMDK